MTFDMELLNIFLALFGMLVFFEAIRLIILSRRAVVAGRCAPRANHTPAISTCSILVIGDSTALGTGATKPESTLVGRLAGEFDTATIVNAAQNAMNLATLEKCLNERLQEKYDFVIIHIGGIDTILLTPLKVVRRRLNNCLHTAQKIARKKVILVSVNNAGTSPFFRFPLSRVMSTRSARVSKISHEVTVCNSVLHIPLFAPKSEDPLHSNPDHFFSSDGIHPNDEGYGVWYEKIRQPLVHLIKQ